MSATDLVRERMKKEKEKDKGKEPKSKRRFAELDTGPIKLDDLPSRVGESGLKRLGLKEEYNRRETISASVPGWIKVALDFIALEATKKGEGPYSGFGGKSRFIAKAVEEKIRSAFPEIYEKLKDKS
ncbi:MAG: hypothetical protein ACFFDJ_00320 [Candidatus Odinarchaeota archaeon]